jgi:tRNA pseudouridine38-40 synthase
MPPTTMRNFKIIMSYDGTDFKGWQKQPGCRTVQETLETALAKLTGEAAIRVYPSGRTDAGVHALGQVAHFHGAMHVPFARLLKAINAHLPDDLVVRSVEEVPEAFDANRSAIRKLYRYVMHDGPTPNPFLRKYCCYCKIPLDARAMARAAEVLKGQHDFHSFETEWPNRKSSVRTITHLSVNRAGEYVWLDVEADGFLYNMVRAIAGTLMQIGRGHWPISKVAEILAAEDRTQAGPTAPAQGLFLMRVTYE